MIFLFAEIAIKNVTQFSLQETRKFLISVSDCDYSLYTKLKKYFFLTTISLSFMFAKISLHQLKDEGNEVRIFEWACRVCGY